MYYSLIQAVQDQIPEKLEMYRFLDYFNGILKTMRAYRNCQTSHFPSLGYNIGL